MGGLARGAYRFAAAAPRAARAVLRCAEAVEGVSVQAPDERLSCRAFLSSRSLYVRPDGTLERGAEEAAGGTESKDIDGG